LADLPAKTERPKSTLPKLIDEYLYVTESISQVDPAGTLVQHTHIKRILRRRKAKTTMSSLAKMENLCGIFVELGRVRAKQQRYLICSFTTFGGRQPGICAGPGWPRE
jgi:hypothetical protein